MSAPWARTRRGELQTATNTYLRPNSGHRIVVVGTIHVGRASYYRDLKQRLLGLEATGMAVHYELVRKPTVAELDAATEEERDAVKRFAVLREATGMVAQLLGLPTQHAMAPLPESWRNVDVSVLDAARAHLDDLSFLDKAEKSRKDLADLDERQRKALRTVLRWLVLRIPRLEMARRLLRVFGLERGGLRSDFVLDHRNTLAVAEATRETGPVVMVWGAGHLAGIDTLLRGLGYRRRETTWDVALRRDDDVLDSDTSSVSP